MPRRPKTPNLPPLLKRKLDKTGQTRGADNDVIYQNRVARSGTVLIPLDCYDGCRGEAYENGFIVLVPAAQYFADPDPDAMLAGKGLKLGRDTLVIYETRAAWIAHPPDAFGWEVPTRRTDPLGGQYVCRIAGRTSQTDGDRIVRGYAATAMKGAGIRVYEYADADTIKRARQQLESLYWRCADAVAVAVTHGMSAEGAEARKAHADGMCVAGDLLDVPRLTASRMLGPTGLTICPLCLGELSASGFFNRLEQAEGRVVHDLTVTQVNLFHIAELRYGVLNHRPYNLGWGHHHCNVVAKDAGIAPTLQWMRDVVDRNVRAGHMPNGSIAV